MEISLVLILILICRIITIFAIVNTYRALKDIAGMGTKVSYIAATLGYLYYISLSTVGLIPHTPTDLLRVIVLAVLIFIASKHIRRKKK